MKKILAVSLILCVFNSYAQKKTIDSLLTFLKTAKEDTMRVNALNNLSFQFSLTADYNYELSYAVEALTLAKRLNWKKGQATALNNIGGAYDNKGNLPEALKYYISSLKIMEEIGDKRGIAYCHNNIGIIYDITGNYEDALKNYFASLKLLQEMGNKFAIASVYNNIGNTYSHQNNYEDALKNLTEGLKFREEIGDQLGIAASYDNIGLIQIDLGHFTEASRNLFAGLKIREENGDIDGMTYSYLNIGAYYLKLNKPLRSKEYLQKSLKLSKEIGSLDNIKECYHSLSAADSALASSPKTPFAERGAFWQSAFENYKLYKQFRDSITNEENAKKLVQTQMQYEFNKKEAANKAEQEKKDAIAHEEAKRQRNIRNSAFFGLAGLLLFSAIVFKQRNKIAKGKKQSDELLLNILPEEVAEELKSKGSAEARQFEEVTILFTDFVNFTGTAGSLSPQVLVAELNDCFSAFDAIIEKNGLEKIKTIGDAYMAVCGLPINDLHHAEKAVQAAIDIRDFMATRKSNERTFDIRIGLNSGSVIAGIVGVKKFQYDIWGDAVNTASRMESSGEVGQVNISETTYALVKDRFVCFSRGKIQAKGKGEMNMYFVEGKN